MQTFVLIVHVLAAISLIAFVLLQHGKGADAGAAFSSGASGTMFGSTGALPILVKMTAVLAAIFFATSLALSYMMNPRAGAKDPTAITAPATPVVPAAPVPK